MKPTKVIFSWSGGKDSSLCLYYILKQKEYEVVSLITSVNGNNKRVSLHGVHQDLIMAQANALNIPIEFIYIYEGSNEEYEKQMKNSLLQFKSRGIDTVIFGDIFLEDLRLYREQQLAKVGMKAVFPLWKMNTNVLVNQFIDLGYKTITCCVNDAYLTKANVGKLIDEKFINELPSDVDACGENGEYHTYCYEGKIFKKPILIDIKETIYKELDKQFQTPDKNNKVTKGFWYSEINLKTK